PLPHDELGTLRQRVVAAQLVVETDPGRRLHGLGRGRAGGHREHEHPDEHRRRPSPAHRPRVRLAYRGRMDGRDPEALVRQFHATYDVPVADGAASVATDRVHMRMALVAEEFAELVAAVYGARAGEHVATAFAAAVADDDGTRDVVAAADALADLVYVVYGMALECGIPLPEVLAEVHASNLSKLGADGRPVHRADGKVLKGPSYAPPDVAGVLARSAERLTGPRRGPPRPRPRTRARTSRATPRAAAGSAAPAPARRCPGSCRAPRPPRAATRPPAAPPRRRRAPAPAGAPHPTTTAPRRPRACRP